MSTGTIKSREFESRQDFVDKSSVGMAEQWCNDCRKILGLKLFRGRDMNKAIASITKDLSDLEDLAPFGKIYGRDSKGDNIVGAETKLNLAKDEFKGISWDLKLLEQQYRDYQLQKKNTKRRSDKKDASANLERIKEEIGEKLKALENARNALHENMKKEKNRQKEILDTIKKSKDGTKILAVRKNFGKELVKLRKLADYFHKAYDDPKERVIRGERTTIDTEFEKFAGVSWLEIDTEAKANEQLVAIKERLADFIEVRNQYQQGKSSYLGAIKEARTLMQRAEQLLSPSELSDSGGKKYLVRFAAGEFAANERDWATAGDNVNSQFVTDLRKRVAEVEQDFEKWNRLKTQRYQELKSQIANLTQREYQMIGLQGIAEAVSLGDQQRDYTAAFNQFDQAELEAMRIIDVDKKFTEEFAELLKECSKITLLANGITGDGEKFAAPYKVEITQLRDEFTSTLIDQAFAKTKVPTEKEVTDLHTLLSNKLVTIQTKIEQLNDPSTIEALLKSLAENKDLRPLIEELQNLVHAANSAVIEYAALALDPQGDPAKITTWKQTIAAATKWLEERKPDLKAPDNIDFNGLSIAQADHKTKLESIVDESALAATNGETAIGAARTALETELNKLKKMLKISRFTTLREATWHGSAVAEVEQLEALLKTDNKGQMEAKKVRAIELQKQCLNVVKGAAEEFIIPNEWNIQYDALKGKLSALIKALKNKNVKKVLPRECERYAGKTGVLVLARAELRNDGPGSMETKFNTWKTRVQALDREVKDRVLANVKALVAIRLQCTKLAQTIKSRISGELRKAIENADKGGVVSGPNLPIYGKVNEVEGYMVSAESVSRYQQLLKQLQNINEEVNWAIEDAEAGDVAQFVEANAKAEEKRRGSLEANMKLQAKYNMAKEAYQKSRDVTKKLPGLDQGEFKRFVGLYKDARKAFKKKNWAEAAKKMDLAYRLMHSLEENPMGSQVTGRGPEHLKELNIRWAKAIDTLNGSLTGLSRAIGKSADETNGAVKTAQVTGKFNATVVTPIDKDLDKAAFQRELLVMQGKPPKGSAEKRKDLDNKKKYREQALVKVRHYQRLLHDHPMYATVMFQSNPWRKEGGTVNALDLMRAINDIDLNVQRGVG